MSGTARVEGRAQAAVLVIALGALLATLVVASRDPRLAVPTASLALVATSLMLLGAESTGSLSVTLGFLTAPMTTLRPTAVVPFLTLSDLLLAGGLALLLPRLVSTRPRLPRGFVVGAWLLVAAGLAPVLASPTPGANLSFLARFVAAVVVLPLLFAYWRPDLATLRRLAWAYVVGMSLGWVVGFVDGTAAGDRQQGMTTHPNFLALTGQTALALLIFLYASGRPDRRWVTGLFLVPALGAVTTSGSRAALVAVVVTAVVYPLASRSTRAAYMSMVSGLVATFVVQRVLDSLGEGSAVRRLFAGTKSTDGSDLQRERALQSGWEDFLSHPLLGGGFTERTLETHNIYVQVAQGAGILGLLGFSLILWTIVRSVLRDSPLATLGYTGLAYAFVGLFQPAMWDRLIWVAIALALVATVDYRDDPSSPDPPGPPGRDTDLPDHQPDPGLRPARPAGAGTDPR